QRIGCLDHRLRSRRLREYGPSNALRRRRWYLGNLSGLGRSSATYRETTSHTHSSCRAARPQLARPAQFELAHHALAAGLRGRLRHHQSLDLTGDAVARIDFFERNSAIDRFAHQAVIVRNAARERIPEHLFDVALAQTGRKHLLDEAID